MGILIRRFGPLLLKLAVLAIVFWAGHHAVTVGFDELRQKGWQIDQLRPAWAILAGVLYLISQLPSGWFWRSVLIAFDQPVPLGRALRAYYIGHLGKYIPGKLMVVVLRAALLGGPAAKTPLAVMAVFYETFTTMAVSAVLALIFLLFTNTSHYDLIVSAFLLAIALTLPTVPPIFIRLLRFLRMLPTTEQQTLSAPYLPPRLIIRGWVSIAVGWLWIGASLWATLRAIGIEDVSLPANLLLFTATAALSVAVGFISMLPAGLGVREVILLELLAPELDLLMPAQGQKFALIAVVVLRLAWLAAEFILAAVLYPLANKPNRNSSE